MYEYMYDLETRLPTLCLVLVGFLVKIHAAARDPVLWPRKLGVFGKPWILAAARAPVLWPRKLGVFGKPG